MERSFLAKFFDEKFLEFINNGISGGRFWTIKVNTENFEKLKKASAEYNFIMENGPSDEQILDYTKGKNPDLYFKKNGFKFLIFHDSRLD